MNLPESIAVGSFVVSTISFMWKMASDMSIIRKNISNDLQHITEEEDKKRGRIYERLDQTKTNIDEKFVRKDMCDLKHDAIEEIRKDVKKLLIKNGINPNNEPH